MGAAVDRANLVPTEEPGHLDFLDGIRGGAALWVLVAHCMIWGGWYGLPLPSPKIAVDIFMVASGFLMVHLAQTRVSKEPAGTWSMCWHFWIRRFFRIAPLYYLALILNFAYGESYNSGYAYLQTFNPRWAGSIYQPDTVHYTLQNFLMHVTFVFGLLPSFAMSTGLPDWSIGLEMQFYGVFPLLFWLFHRLGLLAGGGLIWGAAVGLRWLTWVCLGNPGFPEPSFLPLKLDVFLAGMLVAFVVGDSSLKPRSVAIALGMALLIAWLNSVFVFLTVGLMFLMTRRTLIGDEVVLLYRQFFARFLGNRLTRFMADTSYGVYLTHGFFISLAGGWLYHQPFVIHLRPFQRVIILTAISVAGSYSVAWVLHYLVEKPGILVGRRLLSAWPLSKARTA